MILFVRHQYHLLNDKQWAYLNWLEFQMWINYFDCRRWTVCDVNRELETMNQVWDHHILIASLEPYEWRNCHINGEEVNQMYQVWDGLGFLRRLLQIYCFLTIFFTSINNYEFTEISIWYWNDWKLLLRSSHMCTLYTYQLQLTHAILIEHSHNRCQLISTTWPANYCENMIQSQFHE